MGVHILLKAGVLLLGRAAADEHQPRVLVPGGGIAAAAGRLGLGSAGCAAGAALASCIAALVAGRAGIIILGSGAGIALFTPVVAVVAAAAAAVCVLVILGLLCAADGRCCRSGRGLACRAQR